MTIIESPKSAGIPCTLSVLITTEMAERRTPFSHVYAVKNWLLLVIYTYPATKLEKKHFSSSNSSIDSNYRISQKKNRSKTDRKTTKTKLSQTRWNCSLTYPNIRRTQG